MRCQLRTLAVLLQLLFLIGSGHSKFLRPDEPLWRESIVLDGDETRYTLEGLQQGTSYEVKVSWPATVPSIITLQLGSEYRKSRQRMHRKLLDTEKTIFRADDAKAYSVRMSAKRRSRHRDGPRGGTQQLVYNIVLEPLLFGLPRSVWPVALMCLGTVIGVLLIVPYWVEHIVPWAVARILGPASGKAAQTHVPAGRRRKRR